LDRVEPLFFSFFSIISSKNSGLTLYLSEPSDLVLGDGLTLLTENSLTL